MLNNKKYTTIRFCVHETEMAFEKPFVPYTLISVPRELKSLDFGKYISNGVLIDILKSFYLGSTDRSFFSM